MKAETTTTMISRMKNRDLEEFLDTLGHNFIHNEPEPPQQKQPKLVVVGDHLSNSSEANLLEKMIFAMGIGHGDFKIYACENLNQRILSASKWVIALGEEAHNAVMGPNSNFSLSKGKLVQSSNTMVLTTLHPSELIKQPELKREAWQDLQKMMHSQGFLNS